MTLVLEVKDISRVMKSQEEEGCQEWVRPANFIDVSPKLHFFCVGRELGVFTHHLV